MVLNAAARLIVGVSKYQHITPGLRDMLHFQPVRQWILFKVAVAAFDCVRGTGPLPISVQNVCIPVADIAGRAHLRSAKRCDKLSPLNRTHYGCRWSFHVAARTVWNSLPTDLRSTSIGL